MHPCTVEVLGHRTPTFTVCGPPLRARDRRGPRSRLDDPVRGAPRRRTVLAAARRAVPAERDPHPRRRAAADPVRLVPRRRAPRAAVEPRARPRRAGPRRRRAARPRAAHAGTAARGVAAPAAVRRRPGVRRRLVAADPGQGASAARPPRRRRPLARSRRRRRLRGVHLAVPRGVAPGGRALGAVGRAERDDLRRPRHDRRLEHVDRRGSTTSGSSRGGRTTSSAG